MEGFGLVGLICVSSCFDVVSLDLIVLFRRSRLGGRSGISDIASDDKSGHLMLSP
jgi:hypothetical protein